jgi:hypothetical protein
VRGRPSGAGGVIRGHQAPVKVPRPRVAASSVAHVAACVEGGKGGGDGGAQGRWWWRRPKMEWVERGNGKGKRRRENKRSGAVSKSAYVHLLSCH